MRSRLGRSRWVLVVACVVAAAGCSGKQPALSSHHPGPPTEGDARAAYFDTPLIPQANLGEIRVGMSERALVARLETAAIRFRQGKRTCAIYPIEGTERWDAFGSPVASELELCFRGGMLVTRTRIP